MGKVGEDGFSKLVVVGYFIWNACMPQLILGKEKLSEKTAPQNAKNIKGKKCKN